MGEDSRERRRADREQAFIGAELRVGRGKKRLAVVRDCSDTGVQFFTTRGADIGARIVADVFLEDGTPMRVSGAVVRSETLDTFDGPWRWRVAIQLDDTCHELVDKAARIRAYQQALYGAGDERD